jgi:large conductance mechanosensitive channel
MMDGFKTFIMRGNVVDLAIGVVIGAAFTSIVNSLVKDIITPIIAAIFKQPDFSKLAITINGSSIYYGNFLNAAITFLIIAAVVYYFVVVPLNKLMARAGRDPLIKVEPDAENK